MKKLFFLSGCILIIQISFAKILTVSNHLKEKQYPDKILELIAFNDGEYLYKEAWRIFKYMKETQTFLKDPPPIHLQRGEIKKVRHSHIGLLISYLIMI